MSLLTSLIPSLSRSPAPTGAENAATSRATPSARPAYEVTENADAWGLTVHLPGVAKSGLTLTDEDGVLTIRAERAWKLPAGWTSLYRETSDRPFELVLRHDQAIDVEKIHAELTDGVLRASLPKAEARKPRKIAVS
jgi:HSP20 family molecular chaperone IbpA